MTAKTYDEKSYELAEHFLQDVPHLWTKKRTHQLALAIQEAVEDYIAAEQDNYEPPDPPPDSKGAA